MHPFYVSITVHMLMVIAAMLVSVLRMKGRTINKQRNTPEIANTFMFFSLLVDVISNVLFLFYVIWVNSEYLPFYLCPFYNSYEGGICWQFQSPPLVFVFISVFCFFGYCFGIMFFTLLNMLWGSLRNEKVTEGQRQFVDFLTLRNNEARWAGF